MPHNNDPTYYGLSLLAPKAHVPTIWALLALKAELDSVGHKVADPQMGYIRLKWWEEALLGLPQTANQHPILQDLAPLSTPQLNQLFADMAVQAAEKLQPLPDWAALQRWANEEIWPLWQAWYLLCNNKTLDKKYKPSSQLVALTRLLRQNLAGYVWLPQTLLLNATQQEAIINYCKLLDIEWLRMNVVPAHAGISLSFKESKDPALRRDDYSKECVFLQDTWVQRTWFENFKKANYKLTPHNLANPPLWLLWVWGRTWGRC